ncbi:Phage anti repressor [Weissella confusa LBAE C39-2]|uniref:phage antirepressor KilAC domain-containing protein n=2 Tax=Weissella confusa TaxID=1583 RepID=UPI0002465A0C|nr:phage antirepressor KilAC domain-containing protein [Weissella confusa]MBJ7616769.1 oxidoreductase [Weissella confusa]MBJ7698791.1 oxidoreductase [Weissella confusa]MBS7550741.1 phage antirepressor KilAC domain-containing protein [Weissella confusa]MCQ8096584.1 phage antirepressor KilAC domain-containing protein [Weissella confusa]MCQ8146212.1 phage antirepressor KilAC domain-containing protein [Weissella confusa]
MTNELIKVQTNQEGEQRVSARELYKELGVKTRFSLWVDQNFKMFVEGVDFTSVVTTTVVNNGAIRQLDDFSLTTDMTKNVAMMSKTAKSQEIRDYFIAVEKEHKALMSDPRIQMAMGLKSAQLMLDHKDKIIAEMTPKALFADAVSASQSSILIGELAKLLKQNGVDMGQNRLFGYLRENGYLVKRQGSDRNMPTQKSMELGLFEIKEHNHINSNGVNVTTKTPKVTGKGQQYFINKFLGETKALLEV